MKKRGYNKFRVENIKHNPSLADRFYLEEDNEDFRRALQVLYHIKKSGKLFKPVGKFGAFNYGKARKSILGKFLSKAIPKHERNFVIKDME